MLFEIDFSHFVVDFLDSLLHESGIIPILTRAIALLLFMFFFYIANRGYHYFKASISFLFGIISFILSMLFVSQQLEFSRFPTIIISTGFAVGVTWLVYNIFEVIAGALFFIVFFIFFWILLAVNFKVDSGVRIALCAVISIIISLVLSRIATRHIKPVIIITTGITFGKVVGVFASTVLGHPEELNTISSIVFSIIAIFNQIRFFGFMGEGEYKERFDTSAAYAKLRRLNGELGETEDADNNSLVTNSTMVQDVHATDPITVWVRRTYDTYFKGVLSYKIQYKDIKKEVQEYKTDIIKEIREVLDFSELKHNIVNLSEQIKNCFAKQNTTKWIGHIKKWRYILLGVIGGVLIAVTLFKIVKTKDDDKQNKSKGAIVVEYENSENDVDSASEKMNESDTAKGNKNERSVNENTMDTNTVRETNADAVSDFTDEDIGNKYSDEADYLPEEDGSSSTVDINEYDEELQMRLEGVAERILDEYESDFGIYSLYLNKESTIMYEWHLFGSREGGIYYKITDAGFEKITEWIYDSLDNMYTIDDKTVTKEAVDKLAAEMNTTILICESEP